MFIAALAVGGLIGVCITVAVFGLVSIRVDPGSTQSDHRYTP